MGLFDGFGVCLGFVVSGQGPVDAGQARVVSLAFAGGDDQVGSDGLDGLFGARKDRANAQLVGDDILVSGGVPVERGQIWQRTTGRRVTVTGKREEADFFIAACYARPGLGSRAAR